MRTLALVGTKYRDALPLRGKHILVCTHFKTPAIQFVQTMKALGAEVYYHPIQYSQDNAVLEKLQGTPGITLVHDGELFDLLPRIDIIVEDGARLSKIILGFSTKPVLKSNLFAIEQTTHGFLFWSTVPEHDIPYPIISVANSQIKMHIENNRATPEAILSEFLRATGFAITGKSVMILGYGMIGSGLARLVREHGASVTVIENFPVRRLISSSLGYKTYKVEDINRVLATQDVIISCTNSYGGSTLGVEQFSLMKDKAVVFNGGSGRGEIAEELLMPGMLLKNQAEITIAKTDDHLTCYFRKSGLEKTMRILSSGHPLNLRAGSGTSEDVIDFVFSLMLLAAIETHPELLGKKVYTLEQSLENKLAEMCETTEDYGLQPTHIKKESLEPDSRPYGSVIKFGTSGENLKNFSLARAVFRPGSETKGHYHLNSEEGYYVEQGIADITLWHVQCPEKKVTYRVKTGDYLTIPREFVHHVKTVSEDDFVSLVIASPAFSFWDQFFLDGS